jgi:DNA ligase (NAD+)
MSKNIEERIEKLKKYAELYETNGTSPISDDEYDAEKEACQKLMPNHPFFSMVGGISEEHIYGTKVTHKYIMGSLCKDPNADDFGLWFEKTYGKDIDKLVALLQLKVDGSSFCLKYQDEKLTQGVSRGDGIVGIDYTNNAKYIRGVKEKISAKGYVEIKGEVYKDQKDFISEGWLDKGYANARNFASGAINQKLPLTTKERGLDFIAYEVRGIDFKTETDKVKFLVDNGFKTLKDYTSKIDCKGRTTEEVVNAIKKYMSKVDRNNLPFLVDGIVFKNNDIEWSESMGTTDGGKRPKANRAIKFETEKANTVLEGIEWNIGRTGQLTPVGLLKPVQLAGTCVSRVTLHNLKEMERLGITKTGCIVEVAKQGDIIPKIQKMVKDGDKKIVVPDNCPFCDTVLEWDDTDTTKHCHNDLCSSQVDRNIEHWFKGIDVLGIGQGIIAKLTSECKNSYNEPMVKSVSDMYNLRHFTGELKEMFGDKAADNIFNAVESVKELTLAKFIESLGIANIGRMSKDIAAIAPTIKDIDALKVEDIMSIPGFAETKSQSFISGWKSQRKEIEKILKYITIKEAKLDSAKLAGMKFCFTGSFSNPTRGEMEKSVEANGGKLSSVSKDLTALVWDGEISGSKIEKAKKLGLKIFTQKDFLALLK